MAASSLILFLVLLVVVGAILWVVNEYVPMSQPFKTILNLVALIGVLLWALRFFGIL